MKYTILTFFFLCAFSLVSLAQTVDKPLLSEAQNLYSPDENIAEDLWESGQARKKPGKPVPAKVNITTVNQWGGDAAGTGIIIENLTLGTITFYPIHYLIPITLMTTYQYRIRPCNLEGSGVRAWTRRTYQGSVRDGQEIVLSVDQEDTVW